MKRILNLLVIILALATAGSFIYGIYSFPDAPIRQCGEDCFRNKQGQLKSREDYESFNSWLTITPALFLIAFSFGFTSIQLDKHRRRTLT